MPDRPRQWRQTFNLRIDDTSAAGEVTPQALCAILQDAAGRHAAALQVSPAHLPNQTWFLAGLSLRLTAPLKPHIPVDVETWPCEVERLLALRGFSLHQKGQPVGEALSRWLLIDRERRRPVRIPEAIADLAEPPTPTLPYDPVVEDWDPQSNASWPLTVRHTDIDVNQHVNNAHFVNWLTETVFRQQGPCALRELQIRFDREATARDEVRVDTKATGDHQFVHRIVRPGDKTTLVHARTTWQS